jgi:hypothetical protein
MPRGKNLTLTEAAAFGLFFIHRYRFLTIDQFARIASLNRTTASGQRKGFDLLVSETDIPAELFGGFKEVKVAVGHGYEKPLQTASSPL